MELAYPRTCEFTVEYKQGEAWVEVAKGTTINGEKRISFAPVMARYVRLGILKASGPPTIEEFDIYPQSRPSQQGEFLASVGAVRQDLSAANPALYPRPSGHAPTDPPVAEERTRVRGKIHARVRNHRRLF